MATYNAIVEFEASSFGLGFWRLVSEVADDAGHNVERHVLTKWTRSTEKEARAVAKRDGAAFRLIEANSLIT